MAPVATQASPRPDEARIRARRSADPQIEPRAGKGRAIERRATCAAARQVRRVAGSGSFQVTATRFGQSALALALSAPGGPFVPGEPVPFTVEIDNDTEVEQRFALYAVLVAPGGESVPVISTRGLSLASGGHFETSLSLPVPPGSPLGTWMLGAVLWQPGAGLIERSITTFELR